MLRNNCTCNGNIPVHFGYHAHLYVDYRALKHQVWPLIVDISTVTAYFGVLQAKVVGIARMLIHLVAYIYHHLQDQTIKNSPYFEGKKIPLISIEKNMDKKLFLRGALEWFVSSSPSLRVSLFAIDFFFANGYFLEPLQNLWFCRFSDS